MGGMSDVRLQLLAKELEAGQQAKVFNAPEGLGRWGLMLHRWHTRRALLQLTDDELRDVGLSSEQARIEGRKAFWNRACRLPWAASFRPRASFATACA